MSAVHFAIARVYTTLPYYSNRTPSRHLVFPLRALRERVDGAGAERLGLQEIAALVDGELEEPVADGQEPCPRFPRAAVPSASSRA